METSIVGRLCARFASRDGDFSTDCRIAKNASRPASLPPLSGSCLLTSSPQQPSRAFQRKATPSFSPLRPPPDGRRLAARLGRAFPTAPGSRPTNPTPVCHSPRFHSRPATLPPASVLSLCLVSPCFSSLPLW